MFTKVVDFVYWILIKWFSQENNEFCKLTFTLAKNFWKIPGGILSFIVHF